MKRLILLAAMLAAVVPLTVPAQTESYAPIVLQLAPSPRAAVLGTTAGVRDIDAVFGNPALAGSVTGTLAAFAQYDAARMLTLASSSALGSFNVSIGAQYLDAATDAVRLPLWSHSVIFGGPIPVSSAVGILGMSTTWRGMRVGAAGKLVQEQVGNGQDAKPSLDLGVSRDVGRYTTGVAVQNIGAGIRHGGWHPQLPLRVSAGASTYGMPVGPFDLGGNAGLAVLPTGDLLPSAAVEVGYVPLDGYLFQARIGVRRPELPAQQQLSFGGTFSLDRFTLDYAYEDWDGGGVHRLALRVR